jgi:hypothetical protein
MTERSLEVEGRVVKHLEEIVEQRESFDRVSAKVGEDGFAAAWSRTGTPEQIDLKGAVERAYEQMVNDLHGMLDLVEGEAYRHGVVPDPQLVARLDTPSDARRAWWESAQQLGIDTSQSDQSLTPGRWRRLALYGHLDHELATSLAAWSDSRNLLQHTYAQRTNARGHEVWSNMHALRARLQEVVDAIVELQARCVNARN